MSSRFFRSFFFQDTLFTFAGRFHVCTYHWILSAVYTAGPKRCRQGPHKSFPPFPVACIEYLRMCTIITWIASRNLKNKRSVLIRIPHSMPTRLVVLPWMLVTLSLIAFISLFPAFLSTTHLVSNEAFRPFYNVVQSHDTKNVYAAGFSKINFFSIFDENSVISF